MVVLGGGGVSNMYAAVLFSLLSLFNFSVEVDAGFRDVKILRLTLVVSMAPLFTNICCILCVLCSSSSSSP